MRPTFGHGYGRWRGGFTLIELLVVIGIILIVMGMMLPGMRKFQKRGRAAACASNLHQWCAYWGVYLSEHRGAFPDGYDVFGEDVGWNRGQWAASLRDYYMDNSGALFCPEATKPRRAGAKTVDYGGPVNSYRHAPKIAAIADRSSYGINCWMYDPPMGIASIQGREAAKHFRRLGGVPKPSVAPLFMDTMWRGAGPDYDTQKSWGAPAFNGEWIDAGYEMRHVAMDRHDGGIVVGFADMSVRRVPVRRLWGLAWHKLYDVNRSYGAMPVWIRDLPDR